MRNGCQAAICLIGVCLALVGCNQGRVRTNISTELPATLGLRGFRDAPLLEATIDGIGPVAVVLDTGSTACVVSPELAAQLTGPVRPSRRRIVNAEGSETQVEAQTTIQTLSLGAISFERVDAIVADLSELTRAYGEPIHAIIGYPVFRELPLTIDFARRTVSIESARVGSAERVPVVDSQLPVVRAEIAGQEVNVLIDSASSSGWAVPMEQIDFQPGSRRSKRVLMIDGASVVTDGRLNGVARLGNLTFTQPFVETTRGTPRVGVRGLGSLRVTFDQVQGVVWLEQVRAEANEPHRGIGAELRALPQTWELWSVEPGLPAHQIGLRDGERILAVDGFRVGEIAPAELAERIQRAGRIRLDVMRGGVIEQIYVPVVSLERR